MVDVSSLKMKVIFLLVCRVDEERTMEGLWIMDWKKRRVFEVTGRRASSIDGGDLSGLGAEYDWQSKCISQIRSVRYYLPRRGDSRFNEDYLRVSEALN